ncbi:MAG TPA: hypothetical protein DEV93_18595 [Chloroflexi bacterium]|jgi:hypothetical protein|nr:hypothetical protein [Chloroflexota bacterium]
MSDTMVVPLGPSKAQLRNLATENIERMEDEPGLLSGPHAWLPEVVKDLSHVEVGVFRCVQGGENRCNPGPECWCDKCCTNGELWESPLNGNDWEPECGECGRKALLVEVVGCIDYTPLLAV